MVVGNMCLRFSALLAACGHCEYETPPFKPQVSTHVRTWVSGKDFVEHPGTYGNKGIADPENVPAARYYAVSWIDSSDRLWLFCGDGLDSIPWNGFHFHGFLNDLCKRTRKGVSDTTR
jgi:hypothetical protein